MDPISAYQKAHQDFLDATQAGRKLSLTVSRAASVLSLNGWNKAVISNAAGGYPPELILANTNNTINANEWPTAQQMTDILLAWHKAREEMRNAYAAIPESQRSVVKPPPE